MFTFYRRKLPSLRSLTFFGAEFSEPWSQLFPEELSNIVELCLYKVNLTNESIEDFKRFLNRMANLEVFVYTLKGERMIPTLPIQSVAKQLAHRFPKLRGFGYDMNTVSDGRFEIGEVHQCLGKFKHLSELHISSSAFTISHNVHELLRFVPNIEILSLWEARQLPHLPVAIRRIERSLRKIIESRRDRFPANDRIHIIADQYQYNEFMAIKNIEQILTFSVEISVR